MLMLLTFCTWNIQRWFVTSALRVAAEESSKRAANVLLSSLCDVVIELDGSLRLKTHSPNLACMLLHGGDHSLAGVDIQQFVVEEDRKHFADCMAKCAEWQGSLADVINVSMHDSMNNRIGIQVFHFGYSYLGQDTVHLIGLSEHNDSSTTAGKLGGSFPPVEQTEEETLLDVSGFHRPPQSISEYSVEKIDFKFDALNFTVLECTDSFTKLFGSFSPMSDCRSFFAHQKNADFYLQFQDRVNEFAYDDSIDSLAISGHVILSHSSPFALAVEYSAECNITLDRPDKTAMTEGTDDDDLPIVAHAVFTNVGAISCRSLDADSSCGKSSIAPNDAGPIPALLGQASRTPEVSRSFEL